MRGDRSVRRLQVQSVPVELVRLDAERDVEFAAGREDLARYERAPGRHLEFDAADQIAVRLAIVVAAVHAAASVDSRDRAIGKRDRAFSGAKATLEGHAKKTFIVVSFDKG